RAHATSRCRTTKRDRWEGARRVPSKPSLHSPRRDRVQPLASGVRLDLRSHRRADGSSITPVRSCLEIQRATPALAYEAGAATGPEASAAGPLAFGARFTETSANFREAPTLSAMTSRVS